MPVSQSWITLVGPGVVRRSKAILTSVPGIMCDVFAVCGDNVGQGSHLEEKATPVKAGQFFTLEPLTMERWDEILITDPTEGRGWGILQEFNVVRLEEFPRMNNPTIGSQHAKLFVVRKEKRRTDSQLQFCRFYTHTNKAASNRGSLALFNDGRKS